MSRAPRSLGPAGVVGRSAGPGLCAAYGGGALRAAGAAATRRMRGSPGARPGARGCAVALGRAPGRGPGRSGREAAGLWPSVRCPGPEGAALSSGWRGHGGGGLRPSCRAGVRGERSGRAGRGRDRPPGALFRRRWPLGPGRRTALGTGLPSSGSSGNRVRSRSRRLSTPWMGLLTT